MLDPPLSAFCCSPYLINFVGKVVTVDAGLKLELTLKGLLRGLDKMKLFLATVRALLDTVHALWAGHAFRHSYSYHHKCPLWKFSVSLRTFLHNQIQI